MSCTVYYALCVIVSLVGLPLCIERKGLVHAYVVPDPSSRCEGMGPPDYVILTINLASNFLYHFFC